MKKIIFHILFTSLTLILSSQGLALSSSKHFRIKSNPLSMLFGRYSAIIDVKVQQRISLGAEAGITRHTFKKEEVDGWLLGVHANFALGHRIYTDGWSLVPFYSYTQTNIRIPRLIQRSYPGLRSSGHRVGALMNYDWLWKPGINITLGIGVQYSTSYLVNPVMPTGEASLGFVF